MKDYCCCAQVLCQAAPPGNQLQKEEMRTHQPIAPKEEDQIDVQLSMLYVPCPAGACNL